MFVIIINYQHNNYWKQRVYGTFDTFMQAYSWMYEEYGEDADCEIMAVYPANKHWETV